MKKYHVVQTAIMDENGKESDIYDLVNIEDENDSFMLDSDHPWEPGTIYTEDQFTVEECNCVDDQGTGTGMFAFLK